MRRIDPVCKWRKCEGRVDAACAPERWPCPMGCVTRGSQGHTPWQLLSPPGFWVPVPWRGIFLLHVTQPLRSLLSDRERAPKRCDKCGKQSLCETCFFLPVYCHRWCLLRTGSIQCHNGCVAGKPDLLGWKSHENISVYTKWGLRVSLNLCFG